MSTALSLEFLGGSEFLVGNQKVHKVTIDGADLLLSDVFKWIEEHLLVDVARKDLLFEGGSVRPGILVMVNETDWELLENEKTELRDGDKITFISTLHGG